MLTWAEMGLQEGSRAPGWFNNYNVHIYLDNREDRELTAAAVERDLGRTIQYFMEHPDYAVDFFQQKAALHMDGAYLSESLDSGGEGLWMAVSLLYPIAV